MAAVVRRAGGLLAPAAAAAGEATGMTGWIVWVPVLVVAAIGLVAAGWGALRLSRRLAEQRRRHDETLRDMAVADLRYRFIVENSADIIWQMDSDLRFTFVSGSVERHVGFTAEELIGKPMSALFTPASLSQVMRGRDQQNGGGGRADAFLFEVEMLRKDGGIAHMEVNSRPVRDQTGNIVGYFGITRDITERKRVQNELVLANALLQEKLQQIQDLESQLREQAVRDGLTGLYNRRHFDETLNREIARADRTKQPLSVIMIDIDYFKSVNDTYGHPAGDEVLRNLARMLLRDTRGQDVVCRYGGEEFVALLPGSRIETAAARAEQWRTAFAAATIPFETGQAVNCTISLGVAVFPDNADTGAELLQRADLALYRAKQGGRNRVVVSEMATSHPVAGS